MDILRCAKNKRDVGYVAAGLRSEVTQGGDNIRKLPYNPRQFPSQRFMPRDIILFYR